MTDNSEVQQKMLGTDTDTKKRDSPRGDKTKISLRRVLALLRPYSWPIVAAAIMFVLTTGLGLLFPLVVRTFLDTIVGQHNDRLLDLAVGALFVVSVLQAVLGAVQSYLTTSLGERLSFDLRTMLFSPSPAAAIEFF